MTDEKQNGIAPHYKSDGVAVWVNKKNDKTYLSIKLSGHNTVYAFKNEPKEEVRQTQTKEVNMSDLV